ncbi:MAG: biotin--[acetyl-CoA-carboxylase] ligase [Bacteroidetes bacterium]|nr:biotin--[acetyl-CoA-carboxylase] ligase [Bacteroidota bacterium]
MMIKTSIGNTIIKLDNVDSTNYYALKLLEEQNVEDGTVITANYQTLGKGHGKNLWFSDPGTNLLLSIILFPNFLKAETQFLLNKTISLGILDFVSPLVKDRNCTIKWPNDIYINDRKTAGILIQNSIHGYVFQNTIIGIGINMNQEKFPDDIPNPTSIKIESGSFYDLEACRKKLLKSIRLRYHQLKSGIEEMIHRDYLHSLYWYNEYHNFKIQNRKFKARITGVNEFGKLILEDEKKEITECDFKEVEYLPY